jgi:hypothetical protein
VHLTQGCFERRGIFGLNLVYKSYHTVVRLEVFASALKSASLADHFGLLTVVCHVSQMGIYTLVKLAIATVVDTLSFLSEAFASVLE